MPITASREVPTSAAFSEWMAKKSFTTPTLAAALGCSRSTVWKWMTGRTSMDSITWLACQYVAGTAADARRRRQSLLAVDEADESRLAAMRAAPAARRAAEAAAVR